MQKMKRSVSELIYSALTDENGKPKSTLLLYSFCLSVLFFLLCFATSNLAVKLVDVILADTYPVLSNVACYLCCTLLFFIVSFCFWLIVRDNKIICLLGNLFFFATALVLFICCIVKMLRDSEMEASVFIFYYLAVILVPSMVSAIISLVLYLSWNKKGRMLLNVYK